MFQLSVETEFCAAHAITMGGQREPLHGHNWRVTLTLAGPSLDDDGLLCDFHAAERALREVTAPFQNRDLGAVEPFDRVNPTAEQVARHIAERVQALLGTTLARGAAVAACRVTEAPGCAATYLPRTAAAHP
ncbi:MAG TPA: 6-carboxytetrahydropterin synthase [Phycisphaerales bacterium]|nr:6-carboxytetrahydropterin synthase [Phycisphaerales bacterium]